MKRIFTFMTVVASAALLFTSCGEKNKPTNENPADNVIVSVISNNAEWGTVTGTGAYAKGSTFTISATPNEGYRFVKWDDGNTDNPRECVANENVVYIAQFVKLPQGDGTITVTWDGNTWEAEAIYAISEDDQVINVEIRQSANDDTKPLVYASLPKQPGTYTVQSQADPWMALYADYYGQTYNYQGQDAPYYSPAQGLLITIEAIDVDGQAVSGSISGTFVATSDYVNGVEDMQYHSLYVSLSAAAWEKLY